MFDIAFSELLLIGVVALVVIGPERLPKVARTMGHLFGRLQRYVSQVKSDINREMDMSELSKVKTEFETAARDFQRDVELKVHEAESGIREVESDIDRQLRPAEALPVAPGDAAQPAQPLPEPLPPPAMAPPSAQLELAIDEPAGATAAGRSGPA
jgi:sec-independent protein translocase protein TatB